MESERVSWRVKLYLLVACFFWAASFIASKVALESMPPLTVVWFRLVISAFCFGIWLIFRPLKINCMNLAWMGKLFILSLFGTGLHYSLQTIGIGYTTASNASIYAATGPITISIIAAIFLKEKINWKKGLGIVCALIGVMVVMGIENILQFRMGGRIFGDLLVFSSIFMWGVFTVLGKDMTKRMSAVDLTSVVTIMGAIYMTPLGIIEVSRVSMDFFSIPLDAWLSIAFLGITCSFLSTLLYFFALEETESQKVGVYLYTIPPLTAVIAAIYLKEVIGLNLLVGTLAVLFGVYLTEKG